MTQRTSAAGPVTSKAQRFIELVGDTTTAGLDPEEGRSMRRTGYLEITVPTGGGPATVLGLAPGSAGQEIILASNQQAGFNGLTFEHWDPGAEVGWKIAVPQQLPQVGAGEFLPLLGSQSIRGIYVVPTDDQLEPYWRLISQSNVSQVG